jgi:hypothetical protein
MPRQGKINISLLAFTVYFSIVTLGIPLYKHYCEGDLKLIQFFFQPQDCHTAEIHHEDIKDCCSGACGSEKEEQGSCFDDDGKCCTNKLEYYKVDVVSVKYENNKSKANHIDSGFQSDFYSKIYLFDLKVYPEKSLKDHHRIPFNYQKSGKLFTLYQQFIC